jgi:flagellar motor component MotA
MRKMTIAGIIVVIGLLGVAAFFERSNLGALAHSAKVLVPRER